MREIKFRAWDKGSKRMFPVEQWAKGSWVAIPVQTAEEEWELNQLRLEDIELMQYTGIGDKTDREIYEGDIILHDSGRIGQVIYNHYHTQFMQEDKNLQCENLGGWDDEMIIIGNIYENPKLIEN